MSFHRFFSEYNYEDYHGDAYNGDCQEEDKEECIVTGGCNRNEDRAWRAPQPDRIVVLEGVIPHSKFARIEGHIKGRIVGPRGPITIL